MQIVMIAAVAENGVIGDGKDVPWRIKEDWERFKELTTDNFLIMGRKTYESIGRPLPNRTTVVLTRGDDFEPPAAMGKTRVLVAHSLDEAIRTARTARGSLADDIIYVAGGGEVYAEAMDRADALDITEVKQQATGDVTFPTIDPERWLEIRRESHDGYDFVKYVPRTFTERLTLVPATTADVEDWKVIWDDERIWSHDPDNRVADDDQAMLRLEDITQGWDENSLDLWTIRRTTDDEFLGVGGLQRTTLENGDKVWFLRYQLRPELQGNGYTPEMVTAALQQVRLVDREARVRALIKPRNVKSLEIAEQAGLKRVEERTDALGDTVYLYQGWVRQLS